MKIGMKLVVVFMAVATLTACSLPRGAALQSEIIKGSQAEDPGFSFVPVTRENQAQLSNWPVTGWSGSYNWLKRTRGPESQIIMNGDMVDLVIWDSQENSLLTNEAEKLVNIPQMKVSPSGTIFVPYIDQVYVKGKTIAEARDEIQTRLAPIAQSAQVQIKITGGEKSTIDLVSGVAKPGRYPMPNRNYTILSLLAEGGGISPSLRNPVVRIIRNGKTYESPASVLFSDAARNVILRGHDRVIVEEDKRYFVALGATGKEQLIYFEKEDISTLDALSMLGGLSDSRANPKGVLILREYPEKAVRSDGTGPEHPQVVFAFDLTSAGGLFAARKFEVNPEDVVMATESPVTATRTVLGLIGSVMGIAIRADDF